MYYSIYGMDLTTSKDLWISGTVPIGDVKERGPNRGSSKIRRNDYMAQYLWNGVPISAPVTFRSNSDVWAVEKLDKSFDMEQSPAQRWELSFGLVPRLGDEGHVVSTLLSGASQQLTMVMPQIPSVDWERKRSNSTLPETGQVEVASAAAAGSSTVSIKPSTGVPFILMRGMFIQFDNHDKVYMVTEDVSVAGASTGDPVSIFPALTESLPIARDVNLWDDVLLKHRVSPNDVRGINFIDSQMSSVDRLTIWEDI